LSASFNAKVENKGQSLAFDALRLFICGLEFFSVSARTFLNNMQRRAVSLRHTESQKHRYSFTRCFMMTMFSCWWCHRH